MFINICRRTQKPDVIRDPDAPLAGICAPHLSIVNLTALIWSQIGSQSQRHLVQPNTHAYCTHARSDARSSSHLFNLDKNIRDITTPRL